jgi:hypothetical protein
LQAPEDVVAAAHERVTQRIAVLYAANLIAELKRLKDVQTGAERTALWKELRIGLTAMRTYEYYTALSKEKHAKAAKMETEKAATPDMLSPEEYEDEVSKILGLDPDRPRFDPETQTWSGPNAEMFNEQHKRLVEEEAQRIQKAAQDQTKSE